MDGQDIELADGNKTETTALVCAINDSFLTMLSVGAMMQHLNVQCY